MEIVYNSQTKKINKPSNFEELKEKSLEIYNLDQKFIKNIIFKTTENDNLDNQDDFELLIPDSENENLKLFMNVSFNEDYLKSKENENNKENSLNNEKTEDNSNNNFLFNKILNKLTNIENSINIINNKVIDIEKNNVKTESNFKLFKELLIKILKNQNQNQSILKDSEKKNDVEKESISLLKDEYENKINILKSEIEKEKLKSKKILEEYNLIKKKVKENYNFEFVNNQIDLNKTRKDLIAKSSSLEIKIKNSGKNSLPSNIKLILDNNQFFEIMCNIISKNIEPEKTETINIVLSVKNEKLFSNDNNNKYILKFYLVENNNLNRIGNECLFVNINIIEKNFIDDEISTIFPLNKKSNDDFLSTNNENNIIYGFINENNINNNNDNNNKVNKNSSNNKKSNNDLTEEEIKKIYNKLNEDYEIEKFFKKIDFNFIKNKSKEIYKSKNIAVFKNRDSLINEIYNDLALIVLESST